MGANQRKFLFFHKKHSRYSPWAQTWTGFSSLMSVSSTVQPGFSGRSAMLLKLKTSAVYALAFGVCAVLSACSPSASSSVKNAAAPATVSSQPSIAPITALPPGADSRPLQPGQSGTTYMPNGLPALMPASKGLNADQLFAEKLSSDDARLKRLENAVADLRREFDAVKPAIIRLSAVEADMEELVTQLQSLAPGAVPPPAMPGQANINDTTSIPDIGPMADNAAADLMDEPKVAPVPVAPVASEKTIAPIASIPPIAAQNESQKAEALEKAASKPVAAPAPQTSIAPIAAAPSATPPAIVKPIAPVTAVPGQVAVKGVRIADRDGTTRIVIDMSGAVPFTHSIDNENRVLIIKLPNVTWQAAPKGTSNSALASAWAMASDGQTTVLAINLKKAASITWSSSLTASGKLPHRVVFDLKPSP